LSEIQKKLAEESGLKPRTIYAGIEECVLAGLVERRAGASAGGRPTDIILLTAKGQWTYTRLTNRAPVPSEYDGLLKAHKSDRQTSLVLKTADHFQRLGYTVQREPTTIRLTEDHIFQPDLIAQKDGETLYLEIETGEKLDRPSLAHKWQNAMIVGGGRICVVAPRPSSMTTLQSHILDWATEMGKKPRLYLTNLETLCNCKPGDSPWARIR
jgi:DNA-binding MarR family transcriptional regulator